MGVACACEGGRDGGPRDGGGGGAAGGDAAVIEDVESFCACARRGAGGGGGFFLDPPLTATSLFWASRTKLLMKSMFCVMTASSMPCD